YPAVVFTSYCGTLLYRVEDDYGREYPVNPRESQYLGGHRFDIEYPIEDCSKGEMLAYDDSRTISIATAGIGDGFINRDCIVDLIPS
ncbi:hypothetical protein, partial [Escherichia coli]|uniref:hypothetical protein n=1 Tax=Escherichia coli TaxID=562 RepID=UPI001F313B9B